MLFPHSARPAKSVRPDGLVSVPVSILPPLCARRRRSARRAGAQADTPSDADFANRQPHIGTGLTVFMIPPFHLSHFMACLIIAEPPKKIIPPLNPRAESHRSNKKKLENTTKCSFFLSPRKKERTKERKRLFLLRACGGGRSTTKTCQAPPHTWHQHPTVTDKCYALTP